LRCFSAVGCCTNPPHVPGLMIFFSPYSYFTYSGSTNAKMGQRRIPVTKTFPGIYTSVNDIIYAVSTRS
jgi:hypothetical protein